MILEATELDAESLARYKALGIPLVLLDGYFDDDDTDSVTLDDQGIAYRSLEYLIGMGHRDIGYLQGRPDIMNFLHRRDGFWKALREHGLQACNHPFIELPCSIEGAYRAMKEFLAATPDGFVMPTSFFADLDYIAIGAMRALQEAGWRIPDDISLIASDDISVAAFTTPPLTTTRVNQNDLGYMAVKVLINRMERPETARCLMLISSPLIIRKSVRRLAPAERDNGPEGSHG